MGAAEETRKVKRMVFVVIVPLIALGIGWFQLHAFNSETGEKISLKLNKLKSYYQSQRGVPNKESIKEQMVMIEEVKSTVSSIASYASYQPIQIPQDVAEPGVYFKEKLYLTQKDIKSLAGKHKVTLPGNIGFSEELPEESEVSILLLKLQMVDKVLRAVIENKAQTVHSIEFLESATLQNAREEPMPVTNISLKMEVTLSMESLKKMLFEIGNLNPFVVVEGLHIEQAADGLLTGHFHITELLAEGGMTS